MSSLPTRTTASFDAIKPVPGLVKLDNEFNQYVGACGFLNGGSTGTKLLVKSSDAADPPLEIDQIGAGPLAEWKQNGTLKVSIANSGQIISSLATGTKPLDVTSTTVCTNLNADQVDGFDLTGNKTAFSVTWFYVSLPVAVETTESVPRFLVPPGTTVQIVDIEAVWAGGSASGANNIFTIKRRNVSGTLQADVGTVNLNGVSQNAVTQVTAGLPLTVTANDQIYPLFTTRNTGSEQLVSIVIRGKQSFTT